MPSFENIPFIDLGAQRDYLGIKIDEAIERVLAHGQYILGPEVHRLEEQLALYTGRKYAVSCANGTDALHLVLLAQGVGPGDAVFVPSFTFAATAEVVSLVGAMPVFVDVHADTFNMDGASLREACEMVRRAKELKPCGVIGVDLFGQSADYDALNSVASEYGMWFMVDAAQSFGALSSSRQSCSYGVAATTSFFPAKPLGCYGDGGAVFVDDEELALKLRSLRMHGQGEHKYDTVHVGLNSRLDTLQAAILLEKLAIFPEEVGRRNGIAARYNNALDDLVETPFIGEHASSVWAQYTIKLKGRDDVADALKQRGIPTAIYYPRPLHQQKAYCNGLLPPGGLPLSEALASEVLSLPMHPYLDEQTQDRIVGALAETLP